MKYITIFFLLAMQTCKTTDNSNFIGKLVSADNAKVQVVNCPKNGTCKLDIMRNKTISLQKDGIGKIYPKIIDGANIVVKYTFKKGNPEGYQDGNESETIHFEIKKDTPAKLQDTELKTVNLIFGKNCFCRDIGGYHLVDKGTLVLKSLKNSKTALLLDFSVPKVGERQYISSIQLVLE